MGGVEAGPVEHRAYPKSVAAPVEEGRAGQVELRVWEAWQPGREPAVAASAPAATGIGDHRRLEITVKMFCVGQKVTSWDRASGAVENAVVDAWVQAGPGAKMHGN